MSMHYYEIRKQQCEVSTDAHRKKMLDGIKKKNPKLAAKLARVDWKKINEYVARQALEQVAKDEGLTFSATYDNSGQYGSQEVKLTGKQLGTLAKGRIQLGVELKPDGSLGFFNNVVSEEQGGGHLKKWREAFKKALSAHQLAAIARLLGRDVTVEKNDDGLYVIRATVEVK